MALISIPLTVLALILAPVLPLFANSDGWLPKWLWWFQTPDNSLDGDQGWITEHWLPGSSASDIPVMRRRPVSTAFGWHSPPPAETVLTKQLN